MLELVRVHREHGPRQQQDEEQAELPMLAELVGGPERDRDELEDVLGVREVPPRGRREGEQLDHRVVESVDGAAAHAHKLAARLAGFDYIEEKYLAFGALAAQKVVKPDAPEELEEVVDFG